MKQVVVSGSFDDLRSPHIRFLEEASRLGAVRVLLWPDERVQALTGAPPKFPEAERLYLVEAIRYVDEVALTAAPLDEHGAPKLSALRPDVWAEFGPVDQDAHREYADSNGVEYRWFSAADLAGFPAPEQPLPALEEAPEKRVVVTGCYDWLHSGHVRFFEEASEWGELYVCLGNDENVRMLKGEGHPLFSQDERRYVVQSIRYVKQALVSTGRGWLDATAEIARIKPRFYIVNEDGDKPEKRRFCADHGLEYVVLKRTPKEGLPRRESTLLRGF